MKYYRLDDNANFGTVVRTEGRSQQKHTHDKGWVESGIMIKYFNDESPFYGAYTEITEDAANRLIAL
jgi:hypothetical protein